jgi:hypothetical protein
MMMVKNLSRLLLVALVAIASVAPAQASYVSAVLADNPLVYYRMQEATAPHTATAADSSGNSFNGTYLYAGGGPGSITSIAGETSELTPGKQFNVVAGSGAQIAAPAIGGGSLSAFSIEFLIRPVGDTFNHTDFRALYTTDGGFAAGDVHLNLFPNTSDIQLAVAGNPGPFPQTDLGSSAGVGSWTHVVATYEVSGANNTIKFYANGNLLNGPSGTTSAGSQGANFSTTSLIGAWNGNSRFFSGGLDEFAIYDFALSDAQVAAHFAAVPEPSSLALLAFGAISMFLFRRNKR